MNEMLAYCGLLCQECGAHIATATDDDAKRAEVAAEWSKQFDADLKPSDIDCAGCLSDGPARARGRGAWSTAGTAPTTPARSSRGSSPWFPRRESGSTR